MVENNKSIEDYSNIKKNTTKNNRVKRNSNIINIDKDKFKKLIKIVSGVTLAVGIIIGTGITSTIYQNINNHNSNYFNTKQNEFREEYIMDNTHRTNDKTGYWYDYQEIGKGIKNAEDIDEAIFMCYLNLDSMQTGRVLNTIGLGNFTEYINKMGFKDTKEYEEYMYNKIDLSNEIKEKQEQLQSMIDEHSININPEDYNSKSLGGK